MHHTPVAIAAEAGKSDLPVGFHIQLYLHPPHFNPRTPIQLPLKGEMKQISVFLESPVMPAQPGIFKYRVPYAPLCSKIVTNL